MCEHHHEHRSCHCHEGAGNCGCDEHPNEQHRRTARFNRRFLTKDEEISTLDRYLAELKQEVQAVEERLAFLSS